MAAQNILQMFRPSHPRIEALQSQHSLVINNAMGPLPFAIIDLILNNLHSHEDFQSCSLVSSAWYAPAQIQLFQSITVHSGVHFLRLHNSFLDSTHAGNYIRDVRLSSRIDNSVSATLASVEASHPRIDALQSQHGVDLNNAMDPLPFEIIDLILNNLDSHEDFKSCSLVSSAWCAPAQIRLFHTVTAHSGVRCLRLHNVLLDSPHTGNYIRVLSFRIDDAVSATLASAILPLLKRLLHLSFFNGTWTWPGDRPHELSNILLHPIATMQSRHPLTHVTLAGFSLCNADLQELFMHAPCLKHLILGEFQSLPFDSRPFRKCSDRVSLERLSIKLCKDNFLLGEWLCQPQCSLDLTKLHTLAVQYDPDYNGQCVNIIWRILKSVGQSLKVLGIRRHKAGEPFTSVNGIPWSLMQNSSLRSLTLDLNPWVIYSPNQCPPRWAVSTLPHPSLPSSIEELVIYLRVQDCDDAVLRGSDYRGWIYMASLLTSESFPKLQLVKFVIPLPIRHPELFEYIAKENIRQLGMKWVFQMAVDCNAD
ncbi:hypothetical protein FPV67DRAFT_1152095 [Lyophyllum atratum]|nr:hypothetical protein FPV67DRAFT_1152095 [Lyophyllum atratum]